jgi:hypothetical protein
MWAGKIPPKKIDRWRVASALAGEDIRPRPIQTSRAGTVHLKLTQSQTYRMPAWASFFTLSKRKGLTPVSFRTQDRAIDDFTLKGVFAQHTSYIARDIWMCIT